MPSRYYGDNTLTSCTCIDKLCLTNIIKVKIIDVMCLYRLVVPNEYYLYEGELI